MNQQILPRVIRLRDAPYYLGMDRNRFNAEVRPNLTEIPIGDQGIAFDRIDLDAWFDEYKDRNGRPGKQKGGNKPWDAKTTRLVDSTVGRGARYGKSTKSSEEDEFAKALEKATSRKPKST
jgi:hypothetical protein